MMFRSLVMRGEVNAMDCLLHLLNAIPAYAGAWLDAKKAAFGLMPFS
jgi:hypothetical protein